MNSEPQIPKGSTRRPRFERSGVPSLKLTARDIKIIELAFEHRFLRSSNILRLELGSPQHVLRRLQLLFHHGYLSRPLAQVQYYRQGSEPMVYGLGPLGLTAIKNQTSLPFHNGPSKLNPAEPNPLFLQHTLAVAEATIAIEAACQKNPGTKFLRMSDFMSAYAGREFRSTVRVQHNNQVHPVPIVPDKVFGLQQANVPMVYCLEVDRGTMPVKRKNLNQSSILRKMLAYHEFWRAKGHLEVFRVPRLRVLFLTTTEERADHFVTMNKCFNHGKGSGLFLFGTQQELVQIQDLHSFPLHSGDGTILPLL